MKRKKLGMLVLVGTMLMSGSVFASGDYGSKRLDDGTLISGGVNLNDSSASGYTRSSRRAGCYVKVEFTYRKGTEVKTITDSSSNIDSTYARTSDYSLDLPVYYIKAKGTHEGNSIGYPDKTRFYTYEYK